MQNLPPKLENDDATFTLAQEGDIEAQDRIITGYMRYVFKTATKFASGVLRDELIGEALLALTELVRRFPTYESVNHALIAFRVRGACLDYLRHKKCAVKCHTKNRVVRYSYELSEDMLLSRQDFDMLELSDQLETVFKKHPVILKLRMEGKTLRQIQDETGIRAADVSEILKTAYERWSRDESV